MEIIKHFEVYISAQKATGMQFIVFGILLMVAAILLHFNQLNPITQGMRNGFLFISILLMASGTGFIMNQKKLFETKTETYQTNQVAFEKQEIERMQDVNKSVPRIVVGLSIVLVIVILAMALFVSQPFWKGVGFSILIYLLGLLILESISYLSVKQYLESLTN